MYAAVCRFSIFNTFPVGAVLLIICFGDLYMYLGDLDMRYLPRFRLPGLDMYSLGAKLVGRRRPHPTLVAIRVSVDFGIVSTPGNSWSGNIAASTDN